MKCTSSQLLLTLGGQKMGFSTVKKEEDNVGSGMSPVTETRSSNKSVFINITDNGQTEAINSAVRLYVNELCTRDELINIIDRVVSTIRTRYEEVEHEQPIKPLSGNSGNGAFEI